MKIKAVVFHQPVELPLDRRTNVNTVSEDTFPGVHIELVDHLVTLTHKDWPHDVAVSTANVRFASLYKQSIAPVEDENQLEFVPYGVFKKNVEAEQEAKKVNKRKK